MEIVYVFIIKEKKIVKNVTGHRYVYIIIFELIAENAMEVLYVNMVKKLHVKYVLVQHVVNMEKSNTTAESVLDLLFVNMVKKNQDVKRVVEKVYAKHHYAKLELVKIAKVIVSVALFIRTPTNQMRATTRPRNALWLILYWPPSPISHGSQTRRSPMGAAAEDQTFF